MKLLLLAKKYLGKRVAVIVDRPLGSRHPKHNFIYEVNYGYIPKTKSPDGEELDAYVLGIDYPLKEFSGICIAIVHRLNDDDDKLVVIPADKKITEQEIKEKINFQEKWFKYKILLN